jgi:MFS family permease
MLTLTAEHIGRRIGALALWRPLVGRDFRLLWAGQGVSVLGDQFYVVALPWLTLRLTNSPAALGSVLVVSALPRIVFMLLGGVLSDWFAPRTLIVVVNLWRAAMVVALCGLVWLGAAQLWHLYVFVFALGMANSIFHPAFMAMIPSLLDRERLEAGNTLIQGTIHLNVLVGPALAGLLIGATDIAIALGLDAASFAFAAAMFYFIRAEREDSGHAAGEGKPAQTPPRKSALKSLGEGLHYAWASPPIRVILLTIAVIEFAFAGPLTVGLVALTESRFAQGTKAYGMMLSAFGGGALAGALLAGLVKPEAQRGRLFTVLFALLGLLLILIGLAPTLWLTCGLLAATGAASGVLSVLTTAWLQGNSGRPMRGRVMSLASLATVATAPLSYAAAGFVVERHGALLFPAAGALVLTTTVAFFSSRAARAIN